MCCHLYRPFWKALLDFRHCLWCVSLWRNSSITTAFVACGYDLTSTIQSVDPAKSCQFFNYLVLTFSFCCNFDVGILEDLSRCSSISRDFDVSSISHDFDAIGWYPNITSLPTNFSDVLAQSHPSRKSSANAATFTLGMFIVPIVIASSKGLIPMVYENLLLWLLWLTKFRCQQWQTG